MDCSRVTLTLVCIHAFVLAVECLSFPGGGECGLSGLTFGGRLLVANQDGLPHQWNSRKPFIFRSPRRGRTSLRGHGGRGIIVVRESQSCQAPTTQQQGSCPARGNVPCMDSTTPCSFDFGPPPAPNYANRTPLFLSSANPGGVEISRPEWDGDVDEGEGPVSEWTIMYTIEGATRAGATRNITKSGDTTSHSFNLPPGTELSLRVALENEAGEVGQFTDWQSFTVPCPPPDMNLQLTTPKSKKPGLAKLQATWSYSSASGGCAVKNQTVHFKQLNRDQCDPSETPGLFDDLAVVEMSQKSRNKKGLNPNSLFNVTVTVVTMTGQEFHITESANTSTSVPTGMPIFEGVINSRGGRKRFTWSALPCGQRNADALFYTYTIDVPGQARVSAALVLEDRDGVMRSKSTRLPVTTGQEYTFMVKAYSDDGYSNANTTVTGTF